MTILPRRELRGVRTWLTAAQAEQQATAHETVVHDLTRAHLDRASRGLKHPVEDFLFTYYRHRPQQLARWHPGVGVGVESGRVAHTLLKRRFYTWGSTTEAEGCTVDLESFMASRGRALALTRRLLRATAGRPALRSCFGLHEWAMVYQASQEQIRHQGWPLRLGQRGTDDVVRAHPLKCTHIDAFRFFTSTAAPRNAQQLTRETQWQWEQPGCLHATMDLYMWCFRFAPMVPSTLTMECFNLARRCRHVDMQASPYDLADLGIEPITIETSVGKAQYVQAQEDLYTCGQVLRQRLLAVLDDAVGLAQAQGIEVPEL